MNLLQDLMEQNAGAKADNPQQHQNLLESVASLLSNPQIGGIPGLAALFQSRGLGHLIGGWIGNGANPPVSGSQLEQVLGSQRLAQIAQKLGIDPKDASDRLAAILPHAVDHLTPNGNLPAQGSMDASAMFAALKSKFLNT